MRTAIIFNPTARGDQARTLRTRLDRFARECVLKPTTGPGAAIDLAAESVREGCETIVAAGGDGTVNEVVNGMAAEPEGLERARLGILPLGTINVFARELNLPRNLDRAWELVRSGPETRVDLPCVDCQSRGGPLRRFFAQLAGAGLDSRAISLVNWRWKTKLGPLAYVLAGCRALQGPQPRVTVELPDGQRASGELVVLGNGRFYGGQVNMFPEANLRDGRVAIRVLPRVRPATLAKFGWSWVFRSAFDVPGESRWSATGCTLTASPEVPLELDGDNIGHLPAVVSVRRQALRVIAP